MIIQWLPEVGPATLLSTIVTCLFDVLILCIMCPGVPYSSQVFSVLY